MTPRKAEKLRCGARKKRGGTCQSEKVMLNGRCNKHGGKTPRGLASPHYKHGRYSKDLPSGLRARYAQALTDTTLHALDAEIAVVTARIGERLATIRDGEGQSWGRALECFEAFHAANRAKDVPRQMEALAALGKVLKDGVHEAAVWDDLSQLLMVKVRLIGAESRRRRDEGQVISIERVMVLIDQLADGVNTFVTNPAERAAIANQLGRLAGGMDPGQD